MSLLISLKLCKVSYLEALLNQLSGYLPGSLINTEFLFVTTKVATANEGASLRLSESIIVVGSNNGEILMHT